ncbi:MAG: hypothetical protein V7607_4504 [Solirubrobacteraceae bacterium]
MTAPEVRRFSSGSAFEQLIGYSRAVRIGPLAFVAGTTAAGPSGPVGGDDAAEQMREALRRIEAALREVGAELTDVVRTRIFLTDMAALEAVGQVHGEIFGSFAPVTTIVQSPNLARPDLLVEVEADAVMAGALAAG